MIVCSPSHRAIHRQSERTRRAILLRHQRLSGKLKRMARRSERQSCAPVVRRKPGLQRATPATEPKPRKTSRIARGVEEPTCKVKDLKSRNALRVRRAVGAFVAKVDQARQYERVSADFRPGGALWRSSNRKGKRRLRSAVHRADRLAQAGEFEAALKSLCGE